MSRPSLGPTQPPIQGVPGALSLGVKQPDHDADHSPQSSAEVKNVELYLHSSIRFHGMALSSTGTTLPLPTIKVHEFCYVNFVAY
jgi:hypothetical protein